MNRKEIRKTIYPNVLEGLSLFFLVLMSFYLLMHWKQFPDQVPGHYDSLGNVTRWTTKRELVIVPVVAWMLYLGMTFIGKFPQLWNTGVKITQQNRERIYRILKEMIVTLKFIVVVLFVLLSYYQTTAQQLPSEFMFITLMGIFGILAIFLVRLWRNR